MKPILTQIMEADCEKMQVPPGAKKRVMEAIRKQLTCQNKQKDVDYNHIYEQFGKEARE